VRPARRDLLAAVGVVLLAFGLHARALGHGFVNWDDDRFITDNPLFAASGWTYARAALTRVQFECYQPLYLLSYLPDRWLWPDRPAGFHAGNLILFALDVLLLFRLARRHAGPGAATLAVLLFAAHPLCVEPIDWISDRKSLLSAAFFLGVLLVEDRRGGETVCVSPLGLVLFVAAFLSKTSTLCLPPLLWCWLRWMKRSGVRESTLRTLPYAALALLPAVAVVTIWNQHGMLAGRPVAAPIDVLSTLATYARRIVWPSDLSAIYPVALPAPFLSAALLGAVIAAALISWRRLPPAARFALVAFPVALLPVANVIPINFRINDRYAFLALVVLVTPLAVGLQALFERGPTSRRLVVAGALTALAGLAIVTENLSATWADSRALWAHAARAHPDAYMARIQNGYTLAMLRDWPGARREYQAAVRLLPLNYYAYAGLLYVYARESEEQGRVPSGTANRWRADIDGAQVRSSTFDALLDRVPHAACPGCFDTLLLLRVRRWPRPDDVLRRSARAALDAGAPDVALILLDGGADKEAPEWRALFAEAKRAAGDRTRADPRRGD
jgi:protein O-mannosyl-transferase